MKQLMNAQLSIKNRISVYILILILVYVVAVFQDFIQSKLQHTGFYISESLLYNIYWAFFVPFSFLVVRLVRNWTIKNKLVRWLYSIGIGLVFSLLHILSFALLFVFVSSLIFTPGHRFSRILNTALSNQFHIAFLFYALLPMVYPFLTTVKTNRKKQKGEYSDVIKVKLASKTKTIPVSTIQCIGTDKPYATIWVGNQKFLQDKSLKAFEKELDPNIFLRVHRSTIVNSFFIQELKSRKNGDYDALLRNGQAIRFSRHYRKNWHQLLQ